MAAGESIKSLGNVVVTGGCGFLGHHIVSLLASRTACSQLTVLDIRAPADPVNGVTYEIVDLTDYEKTTALFEKVRPHVVIHTASPDPFAKNYKLMWKVNVDGTKNLLQVSQETGVKAFVYTSSASVIHDGKSDLIYADETYPRIMGKDQPVYYTTTKAQAEIEVLNANRTKEFPKFLTAAIRPSAMFGEGDMVLIARGLSAYYKGQTKVQIGANENLFDFTEITNIAHAHHLAAAALLATRERLDSGLAGPLDYERVDGEAFLITNDSPVYFFDFARMCWAAAGDKTRPSEIWHLSKDLGYVIATLMEWIFWILRFGEPNLTMEQVKYMSMVRYFNISKAKQRLGYRPVVGLEEGVQRAVNDALYRGVVKGQPKELIGKKRE